jgi:hypothetical protein
MPRPPRPFISHAHADKERFVLDFAKRLRGKGIDAWVDTWEMLPGDSLVDKIFNEGLKSCTAFIIVLSKNSIQSKWVHEELNSAIVKRIEDSTKLIPIRLDGCEIPTALKDTFWIEVSDLSSYEREFEQVVNTIYGQYGKPPLGVAPAYVRPDVLKLEGLSPIDSVIFEHACNVAMEQGHSSLIHGERLVKELEPQGISEEQIMETEEILEGRLYIEVLRVMGLPHAYDFAITSYGFDQFAQAGIADYGTLCRDVARLLVQEEHRSNFTIAQQLSKPIRIVDHILETFKYNGVLRSSQTLDGQIHVNWISPELKRKLTEHG